MVQIPRRKSNRAENLKSFSGNKVKHKPVAVLVFRFHSACMNASGVAERAFAGQETCRLRPEPSVCAVQCVMLREVEQSPQKRCT